MIDTSVMRAIVWSIPGRPRAGQWRSARPAGTTGTSRGRSGGPGPPSGRKQRAERLAASMQAAAADGAPATVIPLASTRRRRGGSARGQAPAELNPAVLLALVDALADGVVLADASGTAQQRIAEGLELLDKAISEIRDHVSGDHGAGDPPEQEPPDGVG